MAATDVPCPVCGRGVDEVCKKDVSGTALIGKPHKQRVKLARVIRHKMAPHWRKGDRS